MMTLFSDNTAREKLIGWYHSGPRLRSCDLEINDVVKRYVSPSIYIIRPSLVADSELFVAKCPRPVMVIVDVRQRETGIPTDAYFAVEEIKDVSSFLFVHCFFLQKKAERGDG
jgi:26S proteasome regulatory subunit N8